MNKYFIFLVGIIVGAFSFYLATSVEIKTISRANLGDEIPQVTNPSPSPSAIPVDPWQKIVNDSSLSTVAIQSFQSGSLKKQGSGIMLSSDGLIVTVADIAVGPTVQVLYDDKIVQGAVIKKDKVNNLALVKIDGNNLSVSALDNPNNYESGQEHILTGKLVDLSKITIFSQKALVKYVLENKIILDTQSTDNINGAKAVNHSGQITGMVYSKEGKVHLIKSSIISEFYNTSLNR